jgi:hypothetical protein
MVQKGMAAAIVVLKQLKLKLTKPKLKPRLTMWAAREKER